jgi:hypothetical protein
VAQALSGKFSDQAEGLDQQMPVLWASPPHHIPPAWRQCWTLRGWEFHRRDRCRAERSNGSQTYVIPTGQITRTGVTPGQMRGSRLTREEWPYQPISSGLPDDPRVGSKEGGSPGRLTTV